MNCQNCLFSRKVRMKEEEEEGSDICGGFSIWRTSLKPNFGSNKAVHPAYPGGTADTADCMS
jgi:hypothetical protein